MQLPPAAADAPSQEDAHIERLLADARHSDASEILAGWLSAAPDRASLINLAEVERLQGHAHIALELLRIAQATLGGTDAEDAADIADAFLILQRPHEALAALRQLTTDVHGDPRIRDALGRTYLALGMPAAAYKAFGDSRTLWSLARRARRHAWWRSGGPLRRPDRPGPPPPAPEQPPALDYVLREVQVFVVYERTAAALAPAVGELREQDRPLDAAELLLTALADQPDNPKLLAGLAELLDVLHHPDAAIALLRATPAADAGPETFGYPIELLLRLRRFRGALALVEDLPAGVREGVDAAYWRARTYQDMGLPTLAHDALQADRTPRPWWRDTRRRLWWRTGGPLPLWRLLRRRVERRVLAGWPDDPPTTEPPGTPGLAEVRALLQRERLDRTVLSRANELLDAQDAEAAGRLLADSIDRDGPIPARLRLLAWAEELQGRDLDALRRLELAHGIDPADPQTLQELLRSLRLLGYHRRAIDLYRLLPAPVRHNPDLRSEMAEIYAAMGLPTLALDAFGDPRHLPSWDRKHRRRVWWRSGGPLRLFLRDPRGFEEFVVQSWRAATAHLRVFDRLPWPAGFAADDIRWRVDRFVQRVTVLDHRMWAIRFWAVRGTRVVSLVLAGAALFWTAGTAMTVSAWWAAAAAVAGTAVSFALLRIVFFGLAAASGWSAILLRGAPAGLATVAVGYLLTTAPWPPGGGAVVLGTAVMLSAALALCHFLTIGVVQWRLIVSYRRNVHAAPRDDILDALTGILHEAALPARRNDLDWRAAWIYKLERAARTLERRLPVTLAAADPATANWVAERAGGAAVALRALKRRVAAPVDGSWAQFDAALERAVVAVATGNLGDLSWRKPSDTAGRAQPRWKTALGAAKVLAVAVAPVLIVIAAQPLLQLDTAALRWAKVAGLVWAVLYLLLAVDPTLRDKIDTAQSLNSLLTSARRDPERADRRDVSDGAGGRGPSGQ
ncbi:hypothetical protein Dfulv_19655 [Dactylosporangium fulvum]|uniref:DED domain-containing protein n=1 Tax=Dactylosporangium fulvum TaxID=53359 RepID=A0ABY5WAT4_9ACTN|nr:tetratricopeptide repeat protein [Dactylosporangium fulvum]UWP86329.1 hypothetical protein Dfulv_19655 [Dactylosporangium fulvum]